MVEEVRGSCLGSVGRNGAVKKAMTRGKQIYCRKLRGLGKHLNRRKHTHPARPQERLRLQAPLRRVTRTTGGTHQRDPQPQPSSGSGADPPAAQVQILQRLRRRSSTPASIRRNSKASSSRSTSPPRMWTVLSSTSRCKCSAKWPGVRAARITWQVFWPSNSRPERAMKRFGRWWVSICWTSMTSRTKVDESSACKWLNSDDHPLRLPAL